MTDEDIYLYPGTPVLRNRLNIRNATELDEIEREIVAQRAAQGVPKGKFDFVHLRAIHRHLFQDIYGWAGKPRTVEMSKGGSQFQFMRYIETGMADIHRRLRQGNYLRKLSASDFAKAAGEILGDLNYVHPFREGNGRTQALYLKQLAEQAGHPIDLFRLHPKRWINASIASHSGNYTPMVEEISRAIAK